MEPHIDLPVPPAQELRATLAILDRLAMIFESLAVDFGGEFKVDCDGLIGCLERDPALRIEGHARLLAALRVLRVDFRKPDRSFCRGYWERQAVATLTRDLWKRAHALARMADAPAGRAAA